MHVNNQMYTLNYMPYWFFLHALVYRIKNFDRNK